MARDIKLCCVLVIFILFVVKVDRIEPRGQYDQPLVDSGQYQMQMTAYEDGSQSELIKEIASEEEKRNTKEIHGHTISRETPTETTTQNCDTGKGRYYVYDGRASLSFLTFDLLSSYHGNAAYASGSH